MQSTLIHFCFQIYNDFLRAAVIILLYKTMIWYKQCQWDKTNCLTDVRDVLHQSQSNKIMLKKQSHQYRF